MESNNADQVYQAIIVGAGFSGLAMAISLQNQGIGNFLILEKADEIGGTWRENTYPGAECDIPSALYSYSFEPYPDWAYKWSEQSQILKYMRLVADKHALKPKIRFAAELKRARWLQEPAIWSLSLADGSSIKTRNLISAIGQLHHSKKPDLPGFESFNGASWHSAKWNHGYSLKGKRVAVIGNAASGVQLIPKVAQEAASVKVFQRSPQWILPKQDRAYKGWEKKLVRKLPPLLKVYRLSIWLKAGVLFLTLKKSSKLLRYIFESYGKWYIKQHIKDPTIRDNLTPSYPLGAKRLLFSDSYYQTLAKPYVQLIAGGAAAMQERGVVDCEGKVHEADAVIFATGFNSNPFLLGLDIKGRGGVRIHEKWKNGTKAYLGITVSDFPNLFMMYGPNTNLGHNSIILMIEAQASYIAQCIDGLALRKSRWMVVKESVMNRYYDSIQKRLQDMIWTAVDQSWYFAPDGSNSNNFPGRTMEYMRICKRVNFEDFDLG